MKFKDWHDKEYELPEGRTAEWRPSAYAAVIKEGKLLVVKPPYAKKWELPGGGVDFGEHPIEGMKREFKEELGQDIVVIDKHPIAVNHNLFYAPPLDKYFQALLMVYRADLKNNFHPKVDPKEIQECAWIPLTQLNPETFNSAIQPTIERIKELHQ